MKKELDGIERFNLVVDIGNTNIVFGFYNKKRLIHKFRSRTDEKKDSNFYHNELKKKLKTSIIPFKKPIIYQSIVSSVVPSLTETIKKSVEKITNTKTKVLKINDLNIKLDINNPTELGMDRYINSWWASKKYGENIIVIDFGTATTFDVIVKGKFIGGVIAPGLHLSNKALVMAAAQLEKVEIKKPPNIIGKTTETNVQSGLINGYTFMIEGLIKHMLDEIDSQYQNLHPQFKVVSSGGLGEAFSKEVSSIDIYDANLTIDGLNESLAQS